MIPYLGDIAEDKTVYMMFNTFTSDDPSASCTITNLVATDVHIHKDDGLTQRNNAAGITVSVDFDGITGSHMVKIDTSDDTVAGFWVVGHDYFVRIEGTTIDGATINSVVGHFSIVNRSTPTVEQIADQVWDEILTGATHNIASSAGRRVREIGAFAIESGTARAGTISTITLAVTANGSDGIFNRNLIVLTDNTGKGQTRTIVDYNATSKVVVIDRDWRVTPDATTVYQIVPDDTPLTVDHGVVQGATATTITIRDYASDVDDAYLCNIVAILAGTGRGQARLVGSYDGANRIATICGDDWVTTPDTTSVYAMMPYGVACAACVGTDACDAIADCVLDELTADHTIAGSLSKDISGIKAKTDNLPSGMAKNVAVPKFDVFMVSSSDHVTAATGKTVTGTISKDGGSFVALTNAITEVSGGMYTIASGLTQAERDADVSTLVFTASGCDDRVITIISS